MKKTISELEKGDLLWVGFNNSAYKAKYIGKGIVKIWFAEGKNFQALVQLNWWIFRKKSLWGMLKNILKKY
jgi:hypothetical protein